MKVYDSKQLRYAVADNQNTSSKILDELVEMAATDEILRHKLVANRNTSHEALEILLEQEKQAK